MRATRFRKGGRPLEGGCRKSVGRGQRTKDKATKREVRTRVRCRWGGETEKRRKWAVVIRAKLFLDDFVTVYSMRPNSRIYFSHAALVRLSPNNSIQWFAEVHLWYGPYVSSYFSLPLPPLSFSLFLFPFVKSTCGELDCFSGQSRDLSNILGPNETWREWYASYVKYMYVASAFAEICLLIIEYCHRRVRAGR